MVQCEQFKTAKLILERLRKCPSVEILFDRKVIDATQTADGIEVQVRGPSGTASHSGAYVIGADGGRSAGAPASNSKA